MKINNCGIYCIKNIKDGKRYIGQSRNLYQRRHEHFSLLRHDKHNNSYLQRAWNKYGEDNFNFTVICNCDVSELDNLEKYYIKKYDTMNRQYGYNRESGGNLRKTSSIETRLKISENHIDVSGKNNPFYGKRHSKKSIEQYMSHPNYVNRRHKGQDSHMCVISEDVAYKIKKHFADGHATYKGEVTDIANKYNVSKGIVSHIKNGYTWNWLSVS